MYGTAPFILSVTDDADNTLRIVAALPVIGNKGEAVMPALPPQIREVLRATCPIYPDGERYEIVFRRYIMYQMRNESYTSWDGYEQREGKYFLVFRRSRLLDQVENITIACRAPDGTCFPGEWTHYGIYSQNHILDVIAEEAPVITKLGAGSCEKERSI